jgi:hypothetical protein
MLRSHYQPGLNKTILRLMEIVGAESDFVGEIRSVEPAARRPEPKTLQLWELPMQFSGAFCNRN